MSIKLKLSILAVIGFTGLGTVSNIHASIISVPVSNPSFENPVVVPDTFVIGITNWMTFGAGVFEGGGDFGQDASPTDGNQIAFLNAGAGDMSQTLVTTYASNINKYVLSFDVSSRSAPSAGDSMTVELYHTDPTNVVKQFVLDAGSGLVADVFKTFTFDVFAGDVLSAGGVGNAIGIHLYGSSSGACCNSDFDLDNLRLSAVPEPSTVLLMGIGLAGLGFARRRKTKQI